MKNRKLCLVIPSLQPGGMERVISQLASFFCRDETLEVHMILYGRDSQIFYKIPERLIVHRPETQFNNNLRTIYTLGRLYYLRHQIRSIKPDSILCFGEYWNSFVLLSLFGLNYPVFVSDRCQPDKSLGRIHNKLRKWLYPRATGLIAQTSKAKEIYQNIIDHNNIRVIGNPIPQVNKPLDLSAKENIVLTVGRLIKTKNHDKLIELFVRINIPGWKLIILGDDAQKQNQKCHLQTLIRNLDADKKVILAGNQSDVEGYYLKSKIFAFTSESEGFPNVMGEAQSYGLPVIAFNCIAGPSDLICDKENGFLIPLHDYDLFQEKLTLLMNNEELRKQFGVQARESIKKFSSDYICEQFYNFVLK